MNSLPINISVLKNEHEEELQQHELPVSLAV